MQNPNPVTEGHLNFHESQTKLTFHINCPIPPDQIIGEYAHLAVIAATWGFVDVLLFASEAEFPLVFRLYALKAGGEWVLTVLVEIQS